MEYYELRRVLKETIAQHRADVVLIEDRASGTQLIQELKNESVRGVRACEPKGDKQMRLWAQTATMEQGFVHLPKDAPWLDDYLRELTSFPNGRYDDPVDSTVQAIAWSTEPVPQWKAFMDIARAQGHVW
jgi:predicted phage terminase large subunit-like protein